MAQNLTNRRAEPSRNDRRRAALDSEVGNEAVSGVDPQDPKVLGLKIKEGKTLLDSGRPADAWAVLAQCETHLPKGDEALTSRLRQARARCATHLARSERDAARFDVALEWSIMAASLSPGDGAAQVNWAHALNKAGRPLEAWGMLTLCESFVAMDDNLLRLRMRQLRGWCGSKLAFEAEGASLARHFEGVDWARAAFFRREAVQSAPDNVEYLFQYILTLAYGDFPDKARQVMRDVGSPELAAALSARLGSTIDTLQAQFQNTDFIYAKWARHYLSRNIPVIPNFGKKVFPENWADFSTRMPSEEEVARWDALPWAGIALVLGPQAGISIVDIDAEDPEHAAMIEAALPPSPWRRVGRRGMALAFRGAPAGAVVGTAADGKQLFDVMVNRRTIGLPPSIHPGSGRAYEANTQLFDVVDHLPPLPDDLGARVAAYLEARGVPVTLKSMD